MDTAGIRIPVGMAGAMADLDRSCGLSCVQALSVIAELSPIIEIGAGAGHWYRALSNTHVDDPQAEGRDPNARGPCVDILAYDDGSEVAAA